MEIRLCTNKEEWNAATARDSFPEFLQSYEWGEFQRSVGQLPLRLQALDGGNVVWQGQGFVHPLSLGIKYLYVPRVSFAVFTSGDKRYEIRDICEYLKKQGHIFARFEPIGSDRVSPISLPRRQAGYLLSPTVNRQPQRTLILDVSRSEEEFLAGMHAKTRYNIRVAEKHGVEIREEKNVEVFWKLNAETTARDKFRSHDKTYYARMLECPLTRQYTAWYNGEAIASHIHVLYRGVWTYLHGTSSNTHRNMMAPYLLHWYSIEQAKIAGCQSYDFWGIASVAKDGEPATEFNGLSWQVDHAWTGITRYKAGFGGTVKEYPSAVEVAIRPWLYRAFCAVKKCKN